MSERELFSAVLEKAPEARAAFLDQACAGDAALRRRVEQLLEAHADAGSLLELPPEQDRGTGPFAPAEGPGTRIGPYKLLQELGEGGMGTVFLAEQTEPVRRRVALKVIKAGMDSGQVIARFEAERQALALMDHPNIARVLDAGTIPGEPGSVGSGKPYFVMELVKGIPLTKYCDQEHLTPLERLRLFIPVCHAVQHAHQKGIIHRDLKPSNVLIGLYDGQPVPKVIDFGVAKAAQQKLTERTMFTEVGAIVGTLEYMAPEQAEMNNLDIDTRADIYSLGVLLYELLTGSPPFSAKQLRSVGYAEMLRLIREVEPPKPSTKLSSSDELPGLAARRKLEPRKLTGFVQGDLDWIVMKCLEKDRSRRYETANGLALDVQRFLADEPVLAGPPSKRYRLRKFLRRNKGPVLAAAMVLLALVLGTVGTTVGLFRANAAEADARAEASKAENARANEEQERKNAERARANEAQERLKAERARTDEEQARKNEEQQRKKAEGAAEDERKAKNIADERRRQAEAVASLLEAVFRGLDPHSEKKDELDLKARLIARLDKAVAELDRAAADPLTQARLRTALGIAFEGLGEANQAINLFQGAYETVKLMLGPDAPDTLTSMDNLAGAYHAVGKLNLALPLYAQVLEKSKIKLGPDHPGTLRAMNNLGNAYKSAGKFDLAVPLLEQTLEKCKVQLGPDHSDTLTGMDNLASAYRAAGKLDLALPLYEQALEKSRAKLGADHPNTLTSMNNLASAYQAAGKLDLALPLFEQALEKSRAKLGADHPHTLIKMGNLAGAYRDAGKLNLALPLYEQALEKSKVKPGPDHPNTLIAMGNLAGAYRDAGKFNLALPLYEHVLAKRKAQVGPDHPDTLASMNNLATAYQDAGKLGLAVPLYEQVVEKSKVKLGPDHPNTLVYMNNLAKGYQAADKLDLALPLYEQTLAKRKAKLGPDHPHTLASMNNLASAYETKRDFAKAEPLHSALLAAAKQRQGADHPATVGAMASLGFNLLQQRKFAEAEPYLRVSLKFREQKAPDTGQTFAAKSLLGESLLGQKKYADAEPLLLQGYEGLKQREAMIPAAVRTRLLTGALERLVRLYDEQGQQDKANEWRKKLKELKQP